MAARPRSITGGQGVPSCRWPPAAGRRLRVCAARPSACTAAPPRGPLRRTKATGYGPAVARTPGAVRSEASCAGDGRAPPGGRRELGHQVRALSGGACARELVVLRRRNASASVSVVVVSTMMTTSSSAWTRRLMSPITSRATSNSRPIRPSPPARSSTRASAPSRRPAVSRPTSAPVTHRDQPIGGGGDALVMRDDYERLARRRAGPRTGAERPPWRRCRGCRSARRRAARPARWRGRGRSPPVGADRPTAPTADGRRVGRGRRAPGARCARRRAPRGDAPASSAGSSTFSARVSSLTSSNAWNTNPTLWRRIRASPASAIPSSCSPATRMLPAVGRSRPPSRYSRVDFPQPLGPMIAADSPAATSSCTSFDRVDQRLAAVLLAQPARRHHRLAECHHRALVPQSNSERTPPAIADPPAAAASLPRAAAPPLSRLARTAPPAVPRAARPAAPGAGRRRSRPDRRARRRPPPPA